jgi:hypothetical protein
MKLIDYINERAAKKVADDARLAEEAITEAQRIENEQYDLGVTDAMSHLDRIEECIFEAVDAGQGSHRHVITWAKTFTDLTPYEKGYVNYLEEWFKDEGLTTWVEKSPLYSRGVSVGCDLFINLIWRP